MKKTFRPALAALVAFACGNGSDITDPIDALPRTLSQAERSLVDADNDFALELFRSVGNANAPDSNIFVSPLSVSVALGMTMNGAAGETFDAMANTLHFNGMSMQEVNEGYRDLIDLLVGLDDQVSMDIANSVWHRPEFAVQAPFLDALRSFFDARVEALDFSQANAPDIIDQWASDNTNGLIESIAPRPIPPELVMFLINAVYFKGDWTYQFDKDLTRDATFTLGNGTEVSVPTMSHESEVPVAIGGDELVDIVEMPYGGQAFAMLAAVPKTGVTVDEVIQALDDVRWSQWVEGLSEGEKTVVMPKFEFQYSIRMNDVLAALGMDIAFDPNRADFTGINPTGDLYIDRVDHKTFVRVDEVGTEAAAVTSVGVGVTSAPLPFRIDRPFLIVIRERLTGAILFMGRIVNPLEGQ